MISKENNYAFIDSQNLNLGVQSTGWKYDKSIIVTSDGDFYSLVKYLYDNGKLKFVMSPYVKTCSLLLRKSAKEKIIFMDNLRGKLELKRKNTA
ncbi:MAG: hypothetical protein AAB851_00400 [Patescibacteria group bacterium]